MPAGVIVLVALGAACLIAATYYLTSLHFKSQFREWQEVETLRWAGERQKAIKDAISKSRAVLGGKFTEQMAPFLPEFNYDPTEARFIGSPIDFLVFPGLASGDPKEIVIMEIKSGKNCNLSPQERKIQKLVENGMVRWELIRRVGEEGQEPE